MSDGNDGYIGVHVCPECGSRFDTLVEKLEHGSAVHGLSVDGAGQR